VKDLGYQLALLKKIRGVKPQLTKLDNIGGFSAMHATRTCFGIRLAKYRTNIHFPEQSMKVTSTWLTRFTSCGIDCIGAHSSLACPPTAAGANVSRDAWLNAGADGKSGS
jgi:hypothetical protein